VCKASLRKDGDRLPPFCKDFSGRSLEKSRLVGSCELGVASRLSGASGQNTPEANAGDHPELAERGSEGFACAAQSAQPAPMKVVDLC